MKSHWLMKIVSYGSRERQGRNESMITSSVCFMNELCIRERAGNGEQGFLPLDRS